MDGNSSLYNSSEPAWTGNATGEDTATNDTQSSFTNYTDYSNYEYQLFLYEAFDFERPIYLFIWEILVIFTTLFNVFVILVLLRKKMRNVIHTVLVAIAITDSMTGLVTLPTYIYTYSSYPVTGSSYLQYDEEKMVNNYSLYEEETAVPQYDEFYELDKHWCNAFMVSKYFLSRSFHNISVWLTVFLGVQRFASVRFPFQAQSLFTIKNTFITIGIVSALSPILHMYQLIYQKADVKSGFCHWTLENDGALVHLLVTVLVMHLFPCSLLVLLTILMICHLRRATSQVMREGSSKSMVDRRRAWNKRMTVIVSTIVIVFLIPEIPYGIFLLFTVMQEIWKNKIMPLYVNRAFHAGYEILLVLSFHANFWIYTILNKRFRTELKSSFKAVFNSVCRFVGKPSRKFSITSTSFSSPRTADSFETGKSGKELKKLGGSSTSDSKSERGPLNNPSSETVEKEERM